MPTTLSLYPTTIQDLGLLPYLETYSLQKECVHKVIAGGQQYIFLCEHPAVLTMGRMARGENILWSPKKLKEQGIDVQTIDRGGDVTLHVPGQLVVYPILNLAQYKKDLKWYLNELEECVLELLNRYGIEGRREKGQTGIWVGSKKIVSLGIGVKKWVSFHGVGINVNTDLKLFQCINPCGLDVTMTSMAEVLGVPLNMSEVKENLSQILQERFKLGGDDE